MDRLPETQHDVVTYINNVIDGMTPDDSSLLIR